VVISRFIGSKDPFLLWSPAITRRPFLPRSFDLLSLGLHVSGNGCRSARAYLLGASDPRHEVLQHPPGVFSDQITAQPPPPGTLDSETPILRTLLEYRRSRRVAERTGPHGAPCAGIPARRGRAPGAATRRGLRALALGHAPGTPTLRPARSSPSPLL